MPTTLTIRKPMQYQLTQDELLARLEEHRAVVNDLRDLDEERKLFLSRVSDRKKRMQAEELRLDSVCNQKWENRDVECIVEFHKPVVGQKTTIRTDTGELVIVEDMTDAERQENLFQEQAEFETIVGDIPPASPYDKPTEEPAPEPEIRITEVPPEEATSQNSTTNEEPKQEASADIVGACSYCGKDVPKFAFDEGKCAFCDKPLQNCETCGGLLFNDRVIHSLIPGQCVPRPPEGEDSSLDAPKEADIDEDWR